MSILRPELVAGDRGLAWEFTPALYEGDKILLFRHDATLHGDDRAVKPVIETGSNPITRYMHRVNRILIATLDGSVVVRVTYVDVGCEHTALAKLTAGVFAEASTHKAT